MVENKYVTPALHQVQVLRAAAGRVGLSGVCEACVETEAAKLSTHSNGK